MTKEYVRSLKRDVLNSRGIEYAARDLRERIEEVCQLAEGGSLKVEVLPAVASLLGSVGGEACLRVLRTLVEHSAGQVRVAAINALAYDLRDATLKKSFLNRVLHDPDPEVRMAAAHASGSLLRGTKELFALRCLVESYAKESDSFVRGAFLHAMADILGRDRTEISDHLVGDDDTAYGHGVLVEATRILN